MAQGQERRLFAEGRTGRSVQLATAAPCAFGRVEPKSERLGNVHRVSAVDPNVWTGCGSQVRACCRKSLICIRPVDRRAGRGLDGNTNAPLISLAERLPRSH